MYLVKLTTLFPVRPLVLGYETPLTLLATPLLPRPYLPCRPNVAAVRSPSVALRGKRDENFLRTFVHMAEHGTVPPSRRLIFR